MTVAEFAFMCNGKRIKKGSWIALCPAHPDVKPSLAISEGKRFPLLLNCMSQGCSADSILRAMGISWGQVLSGGSALTPEIRRKFAAGKKIESCEMWAGAYLLCALFYDREHASHWLKAEQWMLSEISKLRQKTFDWDREAAEYQRKVSGARRTQMWAEVGL